MAEASGWRGRSVVVLSPVASAPPDSAVRRRLRELSRALREQGAETVFLHYPVEPDWRAGVPREALAAMSSQWDEHYTIPVTEPPGAEAADGWWDPAIPAMLGWVFRTHAADAFVVHAHWLARAFESCPAGVVRLLDAGGLPEGTPVAADILWCDTADEPPRRPRGRGEGGAMRFGVTGAASPATLAAIRPLLAAILSDVARTLLPCEVVVAGGVCDMLPDPGLPWLRLLGPTPASFYDEVDVVLVAGGPAGEAGLAEALRHGCAVAALAPASAEPPSRHPLHALASLEEMTAALHELVDRPELADELARLSVEAAGGTTGQALDRALALLAARPAGWRPGLCVVVGVGQVFHGSLVLDHVRETAHALEGACPLTVFVDGEEGDAWPAARFDLLPRSARLLVAPHAAVAATLDRLRELGFPAPGSVAADEMLARPEAAFWFAAYRPGWRMPAARSRARAYVHLDILGLACGPASPAPLLDLLEAGFAEVVTLSRDGSGARRVAGGWSHPGQVAGGWSHRAPVLYRGERSLGLARLRRAGGDRVTILADAADDPLLDLVRAVVDGLVGWPVELVVPGPAASGCLGEGGVEPAFLVDISTDPSLSAVREVFERADVPGIRLFREYGLFESVVLLRRFLMSGGAAAARAEVSGSYKADAGWVLIAAEIAELAVSCDGGKLR